MHTYLVSTIIIYFFASNRCLLQITGRVKDRRTLEVRASTLRADMRMLRADLSQLKQFQTFQAQQFEEMIRNAKEQIVQRVARISKGKTLEYHSAVIQHDFRPQLLGSLLK